MEQNIYVISGLGADHTVFSKLNLPGYKLVHIKWVDSVKRESMKDYAKRLLPQITEENPILMGLSLGGMLAVEVGNLIPTKKIISLSSATNYSELPVYFKAASWFNLQRILPIHWFAKGNRFSYWFFGVKSEQDQKVLDAVFTNLERDFLYWALNAILTWDNQIKPTNIYRIHGNADMVLFKKKKVKYDSIIREGTHLMLLVKPQEVSDAILKGLKV